MLGFSSISEASISTLPISFVEVQISGVSGSGALGTFTVDLGLVLPTDSIVGQVGSFALQLGLDLTSLFASGAVGTLTARPFTPSPNDRIVNAPKTNRVIDASDPSDRIITLTRISTRVM
jgi:hypothetical protein